jgi:hypothetical protein
MRTLVCTLADPLSISKSSICRACEAFGARKRHVDDNVSQECKMAGSDGV